MTPDTGSPATLENQPLSESDKNQENTPLLSGRKTDNATFCNSIQSRLQRSGPDGLEAWGVATAAFFINFIMAGINRASGILYVEFIDVFHTDRMRASLPFTIRLVSRNLLGPVVGIFGQKYGVRPIILAGGVLATLSTIACFFVSDIVSTIVFWGFFSGVGTAMIMTLTQAAIGEHFDKHISTASGLGFSGGCFGSFIFPVLFEILIKEYCLQGTFLFIAGFIMHVIPAAIIMKKPTWLKSQLKREKALRIANLNDLTSVVETTCTINKTDKKEADVLERNGSICCEKTVSLNGSKCFGESDSQVNMCKKIDIDFLWAKRKLIIRLLTNGNTLNLPPLENWQTEDSQIKEIIDLFGKIAEDIYNDSPEIEDSINCSVSTPNNVIEKFHSDDRILLYANGNSNSHLEGTKNTIDCLRDLLEKFFERDKEDVILLFQEENAKDLHKIFDELKHIYILLENSKCNKINCNNFDNSRLLANRLFSVQIADPPNTFYSHMKTAMWLHAKPLFLLTCLCRCAHFITFQPMLTTIVDFSRDKGLPAEYGIYAIGTLAFGDLFGRLLLGWLTDKKYLTLPRYMFIFMVLQGIFTMAIALTNSAESLLPVLTVYGLLQGSTFIQHPVLISHYMGKDEQSIALGCLNFFPGVIGFAMPFYIGYFRDTVGSYDGMFFINGSIGVFIGFLWLFEPFLMKCSLRLPQRRQPIPV